MTKEFWMLLSIMNGQYGDGSFDIMIYNIHSFETKYECSTFLRENRDKYITSVLKHYEYKKTIQRILCVPEKTITDYLSRKLKSS